MLLMAPWKNAANESIHEQGQGNENIADHIADINVSANMEAGKNVVTHL